MHKYINQLLKCKCVLNVCLKRYINLLLFVGLRHIL